MEYKLSSANSTYTHDYVNTKPIDVVFINESNLKIDEFTIHQIRKDYSGVISVYSETGEHIFKTQHFMSDGVNDYSCDDISEIENINKIVIVFEYKKSDKHSPDLFEFNEQFLFNIKSSI